MDKCYKIAVVGFGSIGRRHVLNIDKVLKSKNIGYSIDLIRRNNNDNIELEYKNYINNIYKDINDVPGDYDIIFITNPTFLHFDTIKFFSPKTKHMFIEKPVFSDYNINLEDLGLRENGIYYVACPLRHTEVIKYVKENIDLDKVYSLRAICSSYLPDWRPGIDYRTTYSAHLDQGGGVSIDLIHEWDYLIYLFGIPKEVMNYRGKFSNLNIDSDDLSIYIAKYKNMLGEVHLDYFGRKTIRELQLFTMEDTIVADIANSKINFLKSNKVIKFNENRNEFQLKEIKYFFDIIEGRQENINDINTALITLKIAKEGKV